MSQQDKNTTTRYVVYGPAGKTTYEQSKGGSAEHQSDHTTLVYRQPVQSVPVTRVVVPQQYQQTQYQQTQYQAPQYQTTQYQTTKYQAPQQQPTVSVQGNYPVVYQQAQQPPVAYQQPSYQQAAATMQQAYVYKESNTTTEKKRGGLVWLLLILFLLLAAAALITMHFLGVFAPKVTTLSTPGNLRANGNSLLWDEVRNAGGYIVEITDSQGNATEHSTLRNGYSLASLGYGEYTIKVKAVDGGSKADSAWSNSVSYKKLAALSQPQGAYAEGNLLRWEEVPGAGGYWIYIDGKLYESDTNELDLSAFGLAPGNYTIKIKAKGDGDNNADSDWIDYSHNVGGGVHSPAPGHVGLGTNKTITWDHVPNALGYYVNIDGNEEFVNVNSYSVDYLEANKSYKIKIRALFDGYYSEWTEDFIYTTNPGLPVPADIYADGGFLYWTHVLNADGYVVEIDGHWYDITSNKLSLFAGTTPAFEQAKTYTVRIFAKGNASAEDSEWSAPFNFTVKKFSQPSNVRITGSVLFWNHVSDAVGYTIDINGNRYFSYSSEFNVGALVADTGMYTIRIQALGNGWSTRDSDWSTAYNYRVTESTKPTNLSVNETTKTLSWSTVPNVTGYTVSVNGVEYTATTNSFSLAQFDTPNLYVLKVKANGNGDTVLTSEWSDEYYYTVLIKPATPSGISISEGVLSWNSVGPDVPGYFITIDGRQFESTTNSFDLSSLKLEPGTYAISVKAKGNSSTYIDSDWSEPFSYTVSKLEAPGGLEIVSNQSGNQPEGVESSAAAEAPKLTWRAVKNAEKYLVDMNDVIYEVYTNEFSLAGLTPGTYRICVKAVGDGVDFQESDWSGYIYYYVYKLLASENLSLTTLEIKWGVIENARAYVVRIDDTFYTVYTNSMPIPVLPAATYTIRVMSLGDNVKYFDSDWSANAATYTVSRLAAPENLTITLGVNSAMLTWDPVAYCSGYTVNIGGSTHNVVTTSYDLFGLSDYRYVIKVKALANDLQHYESDWSETTNYTVIKLDTPGLTSIANNIMTWTEISGAFGYTVEIDGVKYTPATNSMSISFLKTAKTYPIRIQANGNTTTYLSSEWSAYSYTITQLAAPSVSISGTTATWNTVANATGYSIRINGGSATAVSGTSYSLSGYTGVGIYNVQVMALGNDGEYVDSDWSAAKSYVVSKLTKPTASISGKVVSWGAVGNVTNYTVYVNGTVKSTQTATTYTIAETAVGTYSVQIRANGNGTYYLNSDLSNSVSYTITTPIRTNGCVVAGTLVTLADGTKKPVEQLNGSEMLLVWNFQTGKFDSSPVQFVKVTENTVNDMMLMKFTDGTTIKIARIHGLFDATLNKFVYVTKDNYAQFIGHYFNKQTSTGGTLSWTKVQLQSVTVTSETVTVYNPVTFRHLSCYLNGILTMPADSDGITNVFEVNAQTMQWNMQKYYQDVLTYGLYTYDELKAIINVPLIGTLPQIMFDALNAQYFKIAIGKGLLDLNNLPEIFKHFAASLELQNPIVR